MESIQPQGGKVQAGAGTNGLGTATNGKGTATFSMKTPSNGAAPPPAASTPTIASLLGPKPVFSARIMEEAEQGRRRIAKAVFWLAVFIFLGTYGFFRRELDPNFTLFSDQLGPTMASRFEASNAFLTDKQTDLNLIRFKTVRLQLDEINGRIDEYRTAAAIVDSSVASTLEKQKAKTEMDAAALALKQTLNTVQKQLAEPLGIDVYTSEPVEPAQRDAYFEKLLVEKLKKQQDAILAEPKPNLEEARLVENVLRLIQNKTFRNVLRGADFRSMDDEKFASLLATIREQGTDELSLVDKIRGQRLDWRELISDIHAVVLKADEHYGKGFFESFGGFLFSSYRFDSKTGRISLTGITKTADSRTFTSIVNLVDAVEKSPEFKKIDFRSFSKSKDQSGDYSSSLNLEFSLQEKGEVDSLDEFILQEPTP